MIRHVRLTTCCGLAAVLLSAGCSRVDPVDEISLTTSGVELHDDSSRGAIPPWPAWRGPYNNGIAPRQELPVHWSDDTNLCWQADLPGRGHGSPIVTDELVLVPTARDDTQEQIVLAYDRRDGSQRWQRVVHEGGFPSTRELHKKGTNANGTLVCDGRHVVAVFFNSGKVQATALDLDGEIEWKQEVGPFKSKFGYAPSPILYNSFVIVAADSWGGGYLAALDIETGKIAWRVRRPAISTYSSPAVADVGGRDQLLISGCHLVSSYDPATGKVLWQTDAIAEATCGTVIATEDRIFASGGYPERETVCLDAQGARLWATRTKVYEPSLLAVGDRVFGVTDDGIAYCWAAETGDVLWKKRLGGSFSSSPVACGGTVYVANLSGKTFVFEAYAEQYTQLAVNQLGSDCYASPAVADGKIYLRVGVGKGSRRQERLVCIGKPATEDPT